MKKKTKKKIKLAVFDIDGTIFRSSLLIELINELVRAGVFPRKAKKEMEEDYLAWLNRKGTYDAYINQVVTIHLRYIKGCREQEVLRVARKVVARQKDRVYRFTRDLIKQLRSKKFYIIAISGSPEYIVSMFTKYLRFDDSFGGKFEIQKGIFTGNIISWDSWHDKSRILKNIIRSFRFSVDLKRSVAVGDTASDIPMLKMVGNPIAFNPNKPFVEYAKRRGWRIIVERKDTIYDIKRFDFPRS